MWPNGLQYRVAKVSYPIAKLCPWWGRGGLVERDEERVQ